MPWRRARPVLVTLAVLLAGCSPPRAIEAARVLADLSQPDTDQEARITPASVAFPPGSGVAAGDLYWPGGAEAALVLVPGLVPEGKDDPRLVELAQTLVRARFAVLVPDIAGLRAQQVSPEDARAIAAAIVWLAGCGAASGLDRSASTRTASIPRGGEQAAHIRAATRTSRAGWQRMRYHR